MDNPKGTLIALAGIPIRAADAGEGPESPVWVQIAQEGDYRGYNPPFELNRDIFDQMIENFRNHPSYSRGLSGAGENDVIPWDFHHLSDPSLYDGSTAQVGAPAQGWIRELEVKQTQGGVQQLWALTKWLPLAREYIRSGQYKWASIDFVFGATDPVTGEQVGATLISVALTNDPFIQGMQPLAAQRQGDPAVELDYADSIEDAYGQMRRCFDLPVTAGVGDMRSVIDKLEAFVSGDGPQVVGVDIDGIINKLRRIFNLPVLSSPAEIIGYARALIETVASTGQAQNQTATGSIPDTVSDTLSPVVAEGDKMDELMKTLASAFDVREIEAEIKAAAEDSVHLRAELTRELAVEKDGTKTILETVRSIVGQNDDLKTRAVALSKALGIKDDADPIVRIAELQKAEKELDEARPKLEKLEAEAKKQAEATVKNDVAQAMLQHGLDEKLGDSLTLFRRTEPKKFAEQFPILPPEKFALTTQVASGTKPAVARIETTETVKAEKPNDNVVDFSTYAGRNEAEKCVNYILATNPMAKDWTSVRLFEEVHRIRRGGN
jgi:hypothetical protein